MGEHLSSDFSYLVLGALLDQPVGRTGSFEIFNDVLIQSGQLWWHSENQTYAQDSLHNSIECLIMNILEEFQAVELEYRIVDHGRYTTQDLRSFTITELRSGLLEAISGGVY